MMGFSAIEREGFALRPRLVGSELHVVLSGSTDDEVQLLLPGYFKLMHAEIQRLAVRLVVVDVHELAFITSSCLKALVAWIDLLNGAKPEQRYHILFLKDPHLRWQERSFDALHRMSMSNVSVEDWSGGGG